MFIFLLFANVVKRILLKYHHEISKKILRIHHSVIPSNAYENQGNTTEGVARIYLNKIRSEFIKLHYHKLTFLINIGVIFAWITIKSRNYDFKRFFSKCLFNLIFF